MKRLLLVIAFLLTACAPSPQTEGREARVGHVVGFRYVPPSTHTQMKTECILDPEWPGCWGHKVWFETVTDPEEFYVTVDMNTERVEFHVSGWVYGHCHEGQEFKEWAGCVVRKAGT